MEKESNVPMRDTKDYHELRRTSRDTTMRSACILLTAGSLFSPVSSTPTNNATFQRKKIKLISRPRPRPIQYSNELSISICLPHDLAKIDVHDPDRWT